jgi:hypothetical protein|tara:strand:+ start:866 stop:1111 length:246 start_codon:yes stop_codon:yes gene_type:complete
MSQSTKEPVILKYNGYEDFHITYGYGTGYLTALSKKAKDFFKKEFNYIHYSNNPRWVRLLKADDARKLCEKIRQLGMQFTH